MTSNNTCHLCVAFCWKMVCNHSFYTLLSKCSSTNLLSIALFFPNITYFCPIHHSNLIYSVPRILIDIHLWLIISHCHLFYEHALQSLPILMSSQLMSNLPTTYLIRHHHLPYSKTSTRYVAPASFFNTPKTPSMIRLHQPLNKTGNYHCRYELVVRDVATKKVIAREDPANGMNNLWNILSWTKI